MAPRLTYRVKEAAQLLGLSEDNLSRHPEAWGGVRSGAAIVFPRRVVDAFLYGPNGPEPPLQMVLRLLEVLSPDERRRVALRALQD